MIIISLKIIIYLSCFHFVTFLIQYSFSVIDSKPIGQWVLPLEYLQQREKPDAYSWDQWCQFVNENYKQHQMKLLEKQEKDEKECQARVEAQKKQAEQLSLNLARKFLPGLEIEPQNNSVDPTLLFY